MLSLLLVDDEDSTREGLLEFIDWKKIGIGRVEVAKNGREALELAKSISPDILLTDIRMPNMDGIELATMIRDMLTESKIIFISGFADKEYLKSAIRLNALGYVEKPLNIAEVSETLTKAAQLCINDRDKKRHDDYTNTRIAEGIPLLKLKIGAELAVEDSDVKSIVRELEMTGFDTSFPWKYVTYAIKIKSNSSEASNKIYNPERLLMDILSSDSLQAVFSGFNHGGILILYTAFENFSSSTIDSFAERIKEYVRDEYGNQFLNSVGVGKPVTSLKELSISFQSAMEAVKRIFFSGFNMVVRYEESVRPSVDEGYLMAEEFSSGLTEGNKHKVVNAVKRITFGVDGGNCGNVEKIKAFFLKLFMILQSEAERRGVPKAVSEAQTNDEEIIMSMDTIYEISDLLVNHVEMFFNVIEQKNQMGSSLYDIKKYIDENYSDSNLSVKSIAEYANYSHYYLCNIFKKNTGITLNDYITQVRMVKAKDLLKDKKAKLYEISKKLGYSNPNYFIKIFKKYEGCTPAEFKEKYYI